jgi:hypothetical protein
MHVYNDGGRADAGFEGKAGDCVARAVAIATGKPYAEVYEALAHINSRERITRRTGKTAGKRSARGGIYTKRKGFRDYMKALGWMWTPTMQIGQGCKVHLKADELPSGNLIVAVSRHYVAMIDGAIHDTYDCSRDGTRCVYGYWSQV